MDLNEVSVFIKVSQLGSFSQAARQLRMPNSTVSAKVSSLEKRLGVTLIQRTTRKLSLTTAGKEFFRRCAVGLSEIQAAESEVSSLQAEPVGLLRLTAPVELGSQLLPPIISEYTRRFPKVQVELLLTDRRVELLAEGVDLALRAGAMKDSTLIAKKVGEVFFAPFASPAYLKSRAKLKHPRDLVGHQCLHFTPLGSEHWTLTHSTETIHVAVSSRIIVNDLTVLRTMAALGLGIAMLPRFFCSNEVRSGKLQRVLESWHSDSRPVNFVYPGQRYVSPKLKAFISLAENQVRRSLVED